MSSVAHHDASRSGVSVTAFGVASLRACETDKLENALIHDEYAAIMADTIGKDWTATLSGVKLDAMVTGIAARTRKIDSELLLGISNGIKQVVVLGAGLDCRPWRLHSDKNDQRMEGYESMFPSIAWYELDFQEVFDYKLGKLQSCGASTLFEYQALAANVCIDPWVEKLVSCGFKHQEQALWLLEGFTSYLTSEELTIVFDSLRSISSTGLKMIATFFCRPDAPSQSIYIDLKLTIHWNI